MATLLYSYPYLPNTLSLDFLSPKEEFSALVDHVGCLIPKDSVDRLAMDRESLLVQRVAHAPVDATDRLWSEAEAIEVVLAQLDWRLDSVRVVQLAALHDGEFLSIRMEWLDESRDDRAIGQGRGIDACAVMISEREDPPLDGMGSKGEALRVLQWRAASWEAVAGVLDLFQHRGGNSDASSVGGGGEAGTGAEAGRSFEARGLASMGRDRDRGRSVDAVGSWDDGRWKVVLRRPLQPAMGAGPVFSPGDRFSLAPAVWNASAGDRGGRKSFGLWHTIVLQR